MASSVLSCRLPDCRSEEVMSKPCPILSRLVTLVLTLGLWSVLPLAAQSYATSFDPVKFDRANAVATFHNNVQVPWGVSPACSTMPWV